MIMMMIIIMIIIIITVIQVLLDHKDVAEAQIVGVADTRLGEEVSAWIKLKSGASLTSEMVTKHCISKVSK